MAPGVAFPLLAGVGLLAAVAALGIAAACTTRALRGRGTPPLIAGWLVVAAAEVLTVVRPGDPAWDALLWLRAGGFALVALGLAGSGPGTRSAGRAPPSSGSPSGPADPAAPPAGPLLTSYAVVAPLGAGPAPATAAALAAAAAAVVALRHRRTVRPDLRLPVGLLAAGLALSGAAAALAPAASGSAPAALLLLALRGLGALALLGTLGALARASLQARVVGVIGAAVLAVAIAGVGTGGVAVQNAVAAAERREASAVAAGRAQSLLRSLDSLQGLAETLAGCPPGDAACERFVRSRSADPAPASLVVADGVARRVDGPPLPPGATAAVAGSPLVAGAADPTGARAPSASGLVPLPEGRVALVAAARLADGSGAQVLVSPLDGARLQGAAAALSRYEVTLLADGRAVASSLPPPEARALVSSLAARTGLAGRDAVGRTLLGSGRDAAAHLVAVPGPDGERSLLLAATRSAEDVLAGERAALRRLVLAALLVTVAVAGAGAAVGAWLVRPLRRLTAAAERVRAGDLTASAGVGGADELGGLARAFDAMTASLARSSDVLRGAAQREAADRADVETLLASLSDGVVAADAAGRVTRANRAALALLMAPDEAAVRGRPLADVVVLQGPQGGDLDPASVAVRAGAAPAPLWLARPDGTRRPVAAAAAPLSGRSGETGRTGTVVVLRDRTRELEVERLKTEVLANVSHELRTPLTPIRGYADLLVRHPDLPPEQVVLYAAAVLDAARRLSRVVDLLVDVAALEAGRVVPDPRPSDAHDLLAGRAVVGRRTAPERADDLRLVVDDDLPPLLVDPFWVGRALDELVDNAVRHTPPGTPVTLAAERVPAPGDAPAAGETGGEGGAAAGGPWVALVVRDAGPGVPAEARERVLDTFAQADASATRAVGGLGLGLAFVRRLAEGSGLSLRLLSEPGGGTEVGLVVPTAPDAPAGEPGATGPAPPARPARPPGQSSSSSSVESSAAASPGARSAPTSTSSSASGAGSRPAPGAGASGC